MENHLYSPCDVFEIESSEHPKSNKAKQLHFHRAYELYFLEDGQHGFQINEKHLQAYAQDVILLEPNILHRTYNNKNFTYTSIHFTKDFIKKYYTENAIQHLLDCFNKNIISLDTENFYKVQNILKKIARHNAKRGVELFVYMGDLLDLLVQNMNAPRKEPPLYSIEKITPIISYITENYLEITYLDEIASHFYISKSQLCRAFKENTGITVTHYINQLKVQHSCELLTKTDKNITEIAIECGFNSSVYFCKTFKKQLNCTPSEFRENTAI